MIVAVIWGSAFVAQQDAMETMGPMWFTGIRFVWGALVVIPLAVLESRRMGKQGHQPKGRDIMGFMACGCFLFTASLLQQIGLQSTTVTNSGFLTAMYIPMVPLLGLILFRSFPHMIVWPASLGCVFGIWLLSGGGFDNFTTGDAWTFAGAVFWALHVLTVGYMAQRSGAPLSLAAIQFSTAAFIGILLALFTEDFTLSGTMASAGELAFAGFLSVGIAFTIQAVAQKYTGAADAAIIMSAETLFAALAGAIFQGDRLSGLQYSGAVVVFAAILAVEVLPLLRSKWAKASMQE